MNSRLIVATVKFDSVSGRDVLSGLFAYKEPGYKWRFRIIQTDGELSPTTVNGAVAEGADGFVLSFVGDAAAQRALADSGKPIVTIGARTGFAGIANASAACIINDNKAIGRMGGKYLSSLGRFASYGFVHSKPGFHFSEERYAAFRSFLRKSHESVEEFMPISPEESEEDISAIAQWLIALPKPAAVMAACDRRAIDVIAAAKRIGTMIPGQISLLGVDNDELLAENSEPPLTSILPGHFEMGYLAAEAMAKCLAARRPGKVKTVFAPPNKVIERESTMPLTPATVLVDRAKKFIESRALKGVSAMDVVRHLGCSRNLADLRFKEVAGITIHGAIEKARLDAVKRMVESTGRSVSSIASQCGFNSANRLSHLFKQRFGVSIRQWRYSKASRRRVQEP